MAGIKARTRSNNIQQGFGVDTNGTHGYWTHLFDDSLDNTFYMVSLMHTDQADPFYGGMDHLKIFVQNLRQDGRPMIKTVKGLIKIAKAVATHASASVDSKQPLQLLASKNLDDKIEMKLMSKTASMDIEVLKQKLIDYMKSPLVEKKEAEVVQQHIVQDEKTELEDKTVTGVIKLFLYRDNCNTFE
ncbi:hypothetical protein DAPPUDRAFT_327552 [Daphnia pulex]|uniref:Uncharacterized protein n=1 Tax=Daphnia pulex TaxID=6669 RepID=E9HB67_DAPPU|nr:hypothetical protein DAPPUDRAFT_327552 [Daphnia pulex]|eukprot:EFX71064.1 hypothetical protein DAPPUDRAFT_327552 [Daphnia pulex]